MTRYNVLNIKKTVTRLRPATEIQTDYPDDIARQVMNDLQTRRTMGLERYNQTVNAYDIELDMLWEAYEESLDQTIYLRAAIEQREIERRRQRSWRYRWKMIFSRR